MNQKANQHKSNEYQDPILRAWERVVLHHREPGIRVQRAVLSSWIRSREMKIDPYMKMSQMKILSRGALLELLKENEDLSKVSAPIMDMINISVRGTGFIVALSEKDGYVLIMKGEEDILDMARKNYFVPGCRRIEGLVGTDGIGLCLIEKKPVQVTGAEHYNLTHHPWTCSCVPICDSSQQLLGVLSLVGRSIGRHKHTLALASSAAEAIESQLREKELNDEKQKLNTLLTLTFNSMSDGIFVVNDDLSIANFNDAATRLLGFRRKGSVGQSLEVIASPDDDLIRAIRARTHFTDREISLLSHGQRRPFMCSVRPITDEQFGSHGSLVSFAEKRKAINMVKKIGGNYAKYELEDIKGRNPSLLKQIRLAKIAATTNSRVLITGESGTGKELFAQGIHNFSSRRGGPFVAISCTAIPRDLIEAELFGYRPGAFTGARREGQTGKFELADKGTLFLDEINGMPLDLQSKLLRVLQENEIVKLGDTDPITLNLLIIAASSVDLLNEVRNNNFREDLYYRLNVVEIIIPPLRERIEDLEVLVNHMLERYCRQKSVPKPIIPNEVMDIMAGYPWPGNIRELENCIERVVLMSEGQTVKRAHLPERICFPEEPVLGRRTSHWESPVQKLQSTLKRTNWNVARAAKQLGVARSTLYRKMDEYGVNRKRT